MHETPINAGSPGSIYCKTQTIKAYHQLRNDKGTSEISLSTSLSKTAPHLQL